MKSMKMGMVLLISLVTSANAKTIYCEGIDNKVIVGVTITESAVNGYFSAILTFDKKLVYSTDYLIYSIKNDEYFQSGNSDFMIQQASEEKSHLYLNVTNSFGVNVLPVYNTLPVTCKTQAE